MGDSRWDDRQKPDASSILQRQDGRESSGCSVVPQVCRQVLLEINYRSSWAALVAGYRVPQSLDLLAGGMVTAFDCAIAAN